MIHFKIYHKDYAYSMTCVGVILCPSLSWSIQALPGQELTLTSLSYKNIHFPLGGLLKPCVIVWELISVHLLAV